RDRRRPRRGVGGRRALSDGKSQCIHFQRKKVKAGLLKRLDQLDNLGDVVLSNFFQRAAHVPAFFSSVQTLAVSRLPPLRSVSAIPSARIWNRRISRWLERRRISP